MKKIVEHVDGKYIREWKTGRNPLPQELKSIRKNITLTPHANKLAMQICEENKIDFSSWIEQQIYNSVCIETV